MHIFDTFARIYLCSVSLSGSIADAVNVTEIGVFEREERKGIGEQEVAKRVFLEVEDAFDDDGLDTYLVLSTIVELLLHQTVGSVILHGGEEFDEHCSCDDDEDVTIHKLYYFLYISGAKILTFFEKIAFFRQKCLQKPATNQKQPITQMQNAS